MRFEIAACRAPERLVAVDGRQVAGIAVGDSGEELDLGIHCVGGSVSDSRDGYRRPVHQAGDQRQPGRLQLAPVLFRRQLPCAEVAFEAGSAPT